MKQYFLMITLMAVLLAACGSGNSASDDGALRVLATTGQIGDAAQRIAGDTLQVDTLLGPGIDPHLYVPTEGDVTRFGDADVIFYNGLNLEAQMLRVLEQMESRGITVVAIGDAMPEEQLLRLDEEDGKNFDPHVWNDPVLWQTGVELMRDTLVEADPDSAEIYTANTSAYLDEIAETHAYVQTAIGSIPADTRILVTAHDAFGYFARTYNIEVLGLGGISTESEVSTADVQLMVDQIVERNIPSLFTETSVSPKTMESLVEAAAARGHTVNIGGELFSDALGEAGTDAATYTGMLRHNAQTIAEALGGTP